MQDVYKDIEDYNPGKKCKIIIVYDPVLTELFIRGRKLNISIVLISQSHLKVAKDVRINSTHFLIRNIPNEREIKQISLNHSFDIDFKDFIKFIKNALPNHTRFWLMIQPY